MQRNSAMPKCIPNGVNSPHARFLTGWKDSGQTMSCSQLNTHWFSATGYYRIWLRINAGKTHFQHSWAAPGNAIFQYLFTNDRSSSIIVYICTYYCTMLYLYYNLHWQIWSILTCMIIGKIIRSLKIVILRLNKPKFIWPNVWEM